MYDYIPLSLSPQDNIVTCRSPACRIANRNKKKANALFDLDGEQCCEHLDTLRANAEVWEHLLEHPGVNPPGNDDDQYQDQSQQVTIYIFCSIEQTH